MTERPKWDDYFMEMARLAATRSTCNTSKVGAVIVRNRQVLATGYNGSLPGNPNCCDDPERCSARERPGRKYDFCPAVHAEANAVAQAAKNGHGIDGADVYVTRKPCLICAKLLAASGVLAVLFAGDGEKIGIRTASELVDDALEEIQQ